MLGININKIMMIILEVLAGIGTVIKSEFIVINLGQDKLLGICIIVIFSLIFTIFDSYEENREDQ